MADDEGERGATPAAEQARAEVRSAQRDAREAREDADAARAEASTARAEAITARTQAGTARDEAAEAQGRVDDVAARLASDDPLLDTASRRIAARVDDDNPYGRRGRPLSAGSPFRVAFVASLGVATAYLLVQSLANVRSVLVLIVISAFLAIGLNPTVMRLERRGLSRGRAMAVVFAVVLLVFVGFALAIVPPIASQVGDFIDKLPQYIDDLQKNKTVADLDQRYGLLDRLKSYAQGDVGTKAVGGLVGAGKIVFSAAFSALTVLILTLYFLSSFENIKQTAYRLVPRSRRARVGLLSDEILNRVGGYVAGAATIAAVAGTTTLLWLLVLGVPFPLALALLVAVLDLIPLVGATIGAVVVTIVALFVSLPIGIATAIFYIVYQQVENYLIYPRVMSRSVDVSPAATVVAALFGGTLLGVVGALLAIPVTAAIQLILSEVVFPRQDDR